MCNFTQVTILMTRVVGYQLTTAPCCGAVFKAPRLASISFFASEIWTDGYLKDSLMPNDHGLRRCQCGEFLLESDLVKLDRADAKDAHIPERVSSAELPLAIALARTAEIKLAARLDYWHYLNHPYRAEYRAHRNDEEAATQAAWEAANPDQRTEAERLNRFVNRMPMYKPSNDRPITFPVFAPTTQQKENMAAIIELFGTTGRTHWSLLYFPEILRELGRFDEANEALSKLDPKEAPMFHLVSANLIQKRQTAPVRYQP